MLLTGIVTNFYKQNLLLGGLVGILSYLSLYFITPVNFVLSILLRITLLNFSMYYFVKRSNKNKEINKNKPLFMQIKITGLFVLKIASELFVFLILQKILFKYDIKLELKYQDLISIILSFPIFYLLSQVKNYKKIYEKLKSYNILNLQVLLQVLWAVVYFLIYICLLIYKYRFKI
jgi:hypothetical protein